MKKQVYPLKPDGKAPSPFEKGFYDMIGRYPTNGDRRKISEDQYRKSNPTKPDVWEQALPILAMGLGQAGGGALADSIFEDDGAINQWAGGLFSGVSDKPQYESFGNVPRLETFGDDYYTDSAASSGVTGLIQGLISGIGGLF